MTERTVAVKLKGDISDFNRAMLSASAGAKAFSKELDSSTDRATGLTQSILALGPALVPITAAGVPIVAGLTNELGFAAAGAGVAALAFQGIGDALKATNDYAIKPTEANLNKMNVALDKIGPAGLDFVRFLQDLRPKLQGLQDIAQAGLLPGVETGIKHLMTLLPEVEGIVGTISKTLGDLAAEGGANLADPRWQKFFTFLEQEARPTLLDLGRTVGNLIEGFANLWMAFAPLSDQFSRSFLDLARDFAQWTDGLDKTEGFQEFIDYIQTNGPKAWEALEAVGNALLQIVEAAAPVGAATLPIITALADGIAAIAGSDLGPIVIGVVSLTSALSRLKALGTAANSSAIGGLFGGSPMGGGLSNIKAASAATDELRVAQSRMATAAVAARDAQFALIPTSAKRQALSSYMTSVKGVAEAEKTLGAATKARNAQFRAGAVGVGAMAFVMSDLDEKMGLTNTAMGAMVGSMAGPWGAALGAGIGLVKDFATAGDDATEKIKSLITQVNSAGPLSQPDRYAIEVRGENLVNDEDSMKASDELNAALDRNKDRADDARFAEAGLAAAMSDTSQAIRNQTLALLDNIAKHNERANALLGDRGAMRNIEAAIDNATASVKKNGRTLDLNTQKGRDNQATLDAIAASYNTLSDGAKQNEDTQKRVRKAIVAAGISMGLSAAAARKLARELMNIPSPNLKPKVDLSQAFSQIDKLKKYLKGIKDEEVRINIRKAIESGGGRGHQTKNADGGYITGPGGPRDDLIPSWLSNGEFVVNAAATRQNLGLLHSINSQKFANGGQVGRVQRMASGGLVSSSQPPVTVEVEMRGHKVSIDKDGIGEYVAGVAQVVVSQNNNYAGSRP